MSKVRGRDLRVGLKLVERGGFDPARQRLPLMGVVRALAPVRVWGGGEDAVLVTLHDGRTALVAADQEVDTEPLGGGSYTGINTLRWRRL